MPIKHGTNSASALKIGNDPSCGAFVGTQAAYTPPVTAIAAPTNVSIASEIYGTLVIFWQAPAFPSGVRLRKYDVVLESRQTSSAAWTVALTIPNVGVTKITVAAASPGVQYRAKVQAFGTCAHESPFSAYSPTYTAPEGSLCAGGGCADTPQTFSWPNGNLNNLEGMTLPVYGFTGAIPGWYCNNVDILPKTMFEPSADPGEVCIHLKLCPKITRQGDVLYEGYTIPGTQTPANYWDNWGLYADSWIESTLDLAPEIAHEFRATVARHPNADAGRFVQLAMSAFAAGATAVPNKTEMQSCSTQCCAGTALPPDTSDPMWRPCYGKVDFYDWAAYFSTDGIRLPGSVGQLLWWPAGGTIRTVAGSGADKVRLRFSADGGSHERCLAYKKQQELLPDADSTFQWPDYPGSKRDGWRCGDPSVTCPCPHDQTNCFGLLVDCFLPCRPAYGCNGQWHALPPSYLNEIEEPLDYAAYGAGGATKGVRFAWDNEERTVARCDTIEVFVSAFAGCGACDWPARFDNVPPCSNGEWRYRYYFTEHGQEVGQMMCNGVRPAPELLTLIGEWDMRNAPDPADWWSYTSETLWANRDKWGFVGPVRLDANGQENWGQPNPSVPSCPRDARFPFPVPGALTKVAAIYVPAYNEDAVPCDCRENCDEFANWKLTVQFCGQTMVYASDSSLNTSPIGFRQNFSIGGAQYLICTGGAMNASGGDCGDYATEGGIVLVLDASKCCSGHIDVLATGPSAIPSVYGFCVQNYSADIKNGQMINGQYLDAGSCACGDLSVTLEYFPLP